MGIKRLLAYGAIYSLWGGSYLAIRFVVAVVPPFLAAGFRYTCAALLMCAFCAVTGRRGLPTRHQLWNAVWTGVAMLGFGYGIVYWAETRLPSWMVAVLVSSTFLWTYLGECFVLRSTRMRVGVLLPLVLGLAGMPLILGATFEQRSHASFVAAVAVLLSSVCWSTATLAIKCIDLPESPMQRAAIQLGASGPLLLAVGLCLGEWSRLPAPGHLYAWKLVFGMFYLVVGASSLAFVAMHWLLLHESPFLVASYSYVNPLIAVGLGILIAHETFTPFELLGALIIVMSIVAIWLVHERARNRSCTPCGRMEASPMPDLSLAGLEAASDNTR
jgi:drug/metabolite transporter (DMT)-like permease